MGAPDSPVRHRTGTVGCPMRRHVTQPLGFEAKSIVGALSPCDTGQSGTTPDSLVPSDFAALTSTAALFTSSILLQSTVAHWIVVAAGTPDSLVPSDFAALTSTAALFTSSILLQSTVAHWIVVAAGTPDSPVNYSGARPSFPESGWLDPVRSWCTGHCPVAHQTVRCARPQHTWFLLLL
jgi:hypothetical protein